MRISALAVFFLLNSCCILYGQVQDWVWVKQLPLHLAGTKADNFGNVFLTGTYADSILFDSIKLVQKTSGPIFIVKYDSAAKIKWAKSAGWKRLYAECDAVTVDINGNFYITGHYRDTIAFGNKILIATRKSPIFVVKYDQFGNVIWAKSTGIGSGGFNSSYSISTDNSLNVYITGSFLSGTISFDSINLSLTSGSNSNTFLVKFDSTGKIIWAKSSKYSNYGDVGTSVTNDRSGNIYVTGDFWSDSISFGGKALKNNNTTGLYDIFVVKYDFNGNFIWSKTAGGNGDDHSESIITDKNGNVFIEGYFNSNSIIFGSFSLNNPAGRDKTLTVKFDGTGNVVWAIMNGTGLEIVSPRGDNSISIDTLGNAYITGFFQSRTFTFGTTVLTNRWWRGDIFSQDIFIAKFDTLGNLIWAKNIDGGSYYYYRCGLSVDHGFNIYLIGNIMTVSDTAIFGNIKVLTKYKTAFLAKLGSCNITRPVIFSVGDTTFCPGDSVILNSSPANSYAWSDNSKTQAIVAKKTGKYWVTITNTSGCMITSVPVTVTVNDTPQVPTLTPAGSFSFCNRDSIVLVSSLAKKYLWSDSSTSRSLVVKNSGIYKVIITDSFGCTETSLPDTIVVKNNPPIPVITPSGSTTIYQGDSIKLSSSPAFNYLWSNSLKTKDIFVSTSGFYNVTIFDSLGCHSTSASIQIIVIPRYILVPDFTCDTVCFGNPSILKSASIHDLPVLQYNWSMDPDSLFNDFQNDTIVNYTFSSDGIHTIGLQLITATDTQFIFKNIYVSAIPRPDFDINKDTQVIYSNILLFTNKSTINSPDSFYSFWQFGDGNNSFSTNSSHTYVVPGDYDVKLKLTSNHGCTDSVIKQVHILPVILNVDFTDSFFCYGDSTKFINLSTIVNDTVLMNLWDFGDGFGSFDSNIKHKYNSANIYQVKLIVLTKHGFKDSTIKFIEILPEPVINLSISGDYFIKIDDTIKFYDSYSIFIELTDVFDSFLWSNGSNSKGINIDSPGTYTVFVMDSNGCFGQETIFIKILEREALKIFNVITPNNDGINDVFKIVNLEMHQPCKLIIFDRWGMEVYNSNDYKNDWDGEYKGQKLPAGTYYYILETKDKLAIKGAINIIR